MSTAVVVAASILMPGLCGRLLNEGELLTFADTEPIEALRAILERRPQLIVLERLFADTPRGAALINRIKTDPQIGGTEVRIMSHTGDYVQQVWRGGTADGAPSSESIDADGSAVTREPSAPRHLDWQGTRRANRYPVRPGVEIQLDGNRVTVVDLSTLGAQVLSATILRPNQRVRVSIPTGSVVMRFRGTVAWAKFELPQPSMPPRYRAGIEFLDADAAAIDGFCARHRA
jgi:hypothetical protein